LAASQWPRPGLCPKRTSELAENAISRRVPRASHASAPTNSLYGRVAVSSISSCEVGQSATERWEPGARGVVTVVASRRLKRVRVESIKVSWEIAIVRAERSRSGSMPSTHLTFPGLVMPYFASTLFERLASSFPDPIVTQSSTQNPAAAKSSLA